jgi:phosphoadenosine phosphosulfate reductase
VSDPMMSYADKLAALQGVLSAIEENYQRPVLTVSFGAEDMLLLDLIARHYRGIKAATLDTGRLPGETYDLWSKASSHYRFKIEPFFPEAPAVEQYVRVYGINAFYDSRTERLACCEIRKVEPLKRLLAGRDAWITGLRRAQSSARASVSLQETDIVHGLAKFNPLIDWSEDEVWRYLRDNHVATHALHGRGYPSIGCAPCTRAVAPGEDVRAGRWWWESDQQKECGLHVAKQVAA